MVDVPGGKDSKPKLLAPWGGLNTHADRAAIPENDFSWLENWFPIAPGHLRTTYAEASTLYTTSNPRTVVALFPFNLRAVAYVALFLDDGSALQIAVSNGASTTIGAAGTFYAGGTTPACSQYQSKYLIIGSDVGANAYWVWDGTSLFGAGTLSPQVDVVAGGANYTSTPTLTATGGSGTGATFSTTVANGQVTDATCTNGGTGYQLGEKVTLSFSGGGSDDEAQAVAFICPYAAAVGAVNVTNPGSGFTSTPTVTIAAPFGFPGGGAAPTPTATVSGGQVVSITIGIPFLSGAYFCSPKVTITGGGGTGATAVANINAAGGIPSFTITNPGSGYTSAPTVTLPVQETMIQATASATVTGGVVSAIVVTNPGYGYRLSVGAATVTISGGGGTGATAQVVAVGNMVGRIEVTNSGSGYTSTPVVTVTSPDDPTALLPATATATATVDFSGGTGVTAVTVGEHGAGYIKAGVDLRGGNKAAHATCVLMPFGIQATAIETYNNQVWTSANPTPGGPKMSFTAPNSVSDFGTFSGGGSAPATDAFLRRALTGLRQNSGFLYRFADSSVNVITNVSTATTGITTYNNSNVDTQIGTAWRDTICSFDRAVVFANTTGVYALFSGSVQKVSDELDGLFLNASFNTGLTGVTPTAAVCTMFGVRVYVLLITSKDHLGNNRTFMCCWNGKRWFVTSQIKTPTLIGLQELDSVFTAWATDGTRLFKMFQTASTGLTKTFQTRMDGAELPDEEGRVDNVYLVANLVTGSSGAITMSVDTDAADPGINQTFTLTKSGRQIVYASATPLGATYGTLRGFTGATTAADLKLISIERLEQFAYTRNT